MPRNISFALTTDQVRNRTKTVTRRLGWATLKPGTLLQPVVKAQGIPKGGHAEKIGGLIRVVIARRELLNDIVDRYDRPHEEVAAEGFIGWCAQEFVDMFCQHNKCDPFDQVTRIEFEYL